MINLVAVDTSSSDGLRAVKVSQTLELVVPYIRRQY